MNEKTEKGLFVIIDGIGNIPGTKVIEKASKENFDWLAKNGRQGMFYSVGKGVVPGSDVAHLYIFGYGINNYTGRGPLEALGLGMNINENDIALRANFATVKNNVVIDRRAGRLSTEKAKKLEKLLEGIKIDGYEIIFKASVEHRGVVLIKNKDNKLGSNITPTDPGKENNAIKSSLALDEKSKKTADIINEYTKKVMDILKGNEANALILRGAGKLKAVENFEQRHGFKSCMIAGGSLYKGVARFVGISAKDIKGATGDMKSNYKEKAKQAIKASNEFPLVFVHLKAPDNFGHDGNIEGKIKAYEKIDREFLSYILNENCFNVILITGDHATPCELKRHSSHGAPTIAYGKSIGKDYTKTFNEIEALKGSLGMLEKHDLINFTKDWINKSKKVGS